ncbi:MAG TPA: hypothetical protein VNI55_13485 [Gaiellaceae bacterium]|nr:hypothetical protein [Gaiellaceae bacterium]
MRYSERMGYLLEQFDVDDVRPLVDELRDLGPESTLADDAQLVAEHLYRSLVDEEGRPACALVRLYKSERFDALEPDVQEFVRRALGEEPAGDIRCLALLGTAGDEPAWNNRVLSAGHRAIPLPSEQFVARLPMVAQLITQLGLDLGVVVAAPSGSKAAELSQRTNDVFHVEQAAGSPYLPAQEEFVLPHKIASAVGFGGILLTGDFFSILLFSHVPVRDTVARTLKILAHPVRVRFLRFTPLVTPRR